jgi:hypothetical protein
MFDIIDTSFLQKKATRTITRRQETSIEGIDLAYAPDKQPTQWLLTTECPSYCT